MKFEIGILYFKSSHLKKKTKINGGLSPATVIEPITNPATEFTIEPFNRPISPRAALPYNPLEQAIYGDDRPSSSGC